MTNNFHDLITRMANELDEYRRLLLDDCTVTHRLSDEARAALADEPAVPEVVGSEWQPCVKLPITVHVREQRPGEQHVSTREGITPVRPDDLVMRGVAGEEYPIGRELFQRTYRMGSADEPAVPGGREPAAVTGQPNWRGLCEELVDAWLKGDDIVSAMNRARAVLARRDNPTPQPPADGEVAELVAEIRHFLAGYQQMRGLDPEHIYSIHRGDKMEAHITVSRLTRAAELLEREGWALRRLHRLHQENARFREPERTILCDILANGTLLPDPDGKRYGVQPADGEVAELVEMLKGIAYWRLHGTDKPTPFDIRQAARLTRAADLLQRLSPPQPVPVGERPWEREGWCDTDGLCWLGSDALDGCTPTWLYGPPAWAERFPTVHRVVLPAHALPLPEVGE